MQNTEFFSQNTESFFMGCTGLCHAVHAKERRLVFSQKGHDTRPPTGHGTRPPTGHLQSVEIETNFLLKIVIIVSSDTSTARTMLVVTAAVSAFGVFSMLRKLTAIFPATQTRTNTISCSWIAESVAPSTIRLAK